jgi:hypothetical protein
MAYMPAKVPITETGSAKAGMMVAVTLRKNRKITSTTSAAVSINVNCTSLTELRIDTERSLKTDSFAAAGSSASNTGKSARMLSTTWTVLASGWRCMPRMIERWPLYQPATWSFSTPSTTDATSWSRTGAPSR